jgi:thermostable 8-oxoguanine DNA glycosylase
MTKEEKYQAIYSLALKALSDIIREAKLSQDILSKYLYIEKDIGSLNAISERLFRSLKNRNQMSSVIDFSGREKTLKSILFDFDCKQISNKWTDDSLFAEFRKNFDIKNAESKSNLWWQFTKGIVSGSLFLSTFKDANEFDLFVSRFSLNKFTKAALPMLLSKEIHGLGFALACDFLKELGYSDYPKPDVHLIKIFSRLDLCEDSDFDTYKAIIEMSENVKETPYAVDKVFWLISSGRFYNEDVKVKGKREEFLAIAEHKLSQQNA